MKPTRFNDGVVNIYKEKERTTDFGAKRNATTLEDMEFVVRLDFQESSKRAQDLEFAEQSGFQLSMKIRTRFNSAVRTKMKAVINGYLFDISYIDISRTTQEMFLYMEGVREIAEAN